MFGILDNNKWTAILIFLFEKKYISSYVSRFLNEFVWDIFTFQIFIMKLIDHVWIYLILLNIFSYFSVSAQNKQQGSIKFANASGKGTPAPNPTTREQTKNKPADDDSCIVPEKSLDKTITYSCPSVSCETHSGHVPKHTLASIMCKPNYYPEKKTPSSSTCSNKTWIPPIEDCFKKCDKLNPVNVNLRCIRNGIDVPCDENTLIAGTKVQPTCKPFHTYSYMAPNYFEMTCEEDGRWDRTLFSCIPECGKVYSNSTQIFEYPWHVAIYNSKKVLICGGTIISSYTVLTAAHCFHEGNILINNTSNYEVVTSKVTRNYNTKDNDNQKSYKIKEIRFSSKGYFGAADRYSSDIALIILEEKLAIGAAVLPACVDWITTKREVYPAENSPAQVSGWGANERGLPNEKLTTTNLQFVSRKRCVPLVPPDFKPFVTFDKFCAVVEGDRQGPNVMIQGNAGGGLIFQEGSFYYVKGIASREQPMLSSLATFTNLVDHIELITAAYGETENRTLSVKKVTPVSSGEEICVNYGVSNCTKIQDCFLADVLIITKKAIFCGYDIDDSERICCVPAYLQQVTPPPVVSSSVTTMPPNQTTVTMKSSGAAATYCAKYSKQFTECIKNEEPRIGEIKPALDREFPHVAVIGCGDELKEAYGCLMGSLISESFILSVPPKDTNTIIKWALLGTMVKYLSSSFSRNEPYIIDKHYFHPDFAYPRNSIALYKLQSPVTITSFIRPACLYTSDFSLVNRKLSTTSWGNSRRFTDKSTSSDLFKTSAIVIDDEQCSSDDEKASYDPNSMACVANLTNTKAYSLINRGSPLKIPNENKPCMWSIFGVFLETHKTFRSGDVLVKSNPFIYTKVSYYLDWIEGIVWPMSSASKNAPQVSSAATRITQHKVQVPVQHASTQSSAQIASSHCERYSRYATDCVDDAPPRQTRRRALAKEYPHIAYIGCECNKARTYWTYNGALISERFVLSTAYCNTEGKGEAKWVHLGAIIKSTVKSETYDKMYDVERSYVHPEYNFPGKSIALYKLRNTVEFNSYIRPACLYTSNLNQINSGLRIASWGTKTIQGANSDDLLKGVITVVDDQRCSSVTGYDSNSMACVGDVADGEAQCLMSTGTPIHVLKRNTSCMWTIYAMHFGHVTLPQSCRNVENATPQLFTKISHYLDWIQGIVWP